MNNCRSRLVVILFGLNLVGNAGAANITIKPFNLAKEPLGVSVKVAVVRMTETQQKLVLRIVQDNLNITSIEDLINPAINGLRPLNISVDKGKQVQIGIIPTNNSATITFNDNDANDPQAPPKSEDAENKTVCLIFARNGKSVTSFMPYVLAADQSIQVAVPDVTTVRKPCPQRCRPRCRAFRRFRCAAFETVQEKGGFLTAQKWGEALLKDGVDPSATELRNWTSSASKKVVSARLLDVEGEVALFQRKDGSFATARLEKLSRADNAFIEAWQLADVLVAK